MTKAKTTFCFSGACHVLRVACMACHDVGFLLLSCQGLTYGGLMLRALRVHRLGLEQFQGTGLPGDHLFIGLQGALSHTGMLQQQAHPFGAHHPRAEYQVT